MRSFKRPASRGDVISSGPMATASATSKPPASESMAALYMSRSVSASASTAGSMRTGAPPPSSRSAVSTSSASSSNNYHTHMGPAHPPPPPVAHARGQQVPLSSTASASTSAPPQQLPDNYFRFTDTHQQLLLAQSRRHASALVVDALHDTAKWRFLTELTATSSLQDAVSTSKSSNADDHSSTRASRFVTPAQRNLEVFELKPLAIDRVACVAPKLASDPHQLALRSHTLLAKTRVRGKLDEFMAWMTSRRRVLCQSMMATLHDDHVPHSDVFAGFRGENPQNAHELDQFALKYFIVEPTAASQDAIKANTVAMASAVGGSPTNPYQNTSTPTMASSMGSSAKRSFGFLRRKGGSELKPNDPTTQQSLVHREHTQQQPLQQPQPCASSNVPEDRMHFCIGEYSTVRTGLLRPSVEAQSLTGALDQRVGIISYHSVEDAELLQLCNSVANKTTPRSVSQCTSRMLLQFSGIIAYPVASETDDGAEYLEVVIKVSCFDARGLSPQKRASMFTFIAAFRNLAHMMLVMKLRASPFLTATHWVADERRKCCLVCQQRFSSLRRRHHCRLCGEVTCAKCSTVHQVRLVKEAKVSLRICLLCIQGVERPKWKELVVKGELAEQQQEQHERQQVDPQTPRQRSGDQEDNSQHDDECSDEDHASENSDQRPAKESDPIDLLTLSFVRDLEKPTLSPASSATDSSSPLDPLLRSHGASLSDQLVDADTGSDVANAIQHSNDSALCPSPKPTSDATEMVTSDRIELVEDEENDEVDERPSELPVETVTVLDDSLDQLDEATISVRELSDEEDEVDRDEDYARLQCLAAYGLLDGEDSADRVIPEDLTLQIVVKEVAQLMDCAIAAIGFVDASRDMVYATYSASPLCQVPRGMLPKQYSLTWQVMERASQQHCERGERPSVVVLDATKDFVLDSNPFVLDTPFVRFMVGIPIRSWNGVVIGAIMVADIQPRNEVSSDHVSALKNHAALVESWLENARQEIIAKASSSGGTRVEKLQDRLAEMLHTSYKTTLELQLRSMQMQQQQQHQPPPVAPSQPSTTSTSSSSLRHVLFE